MISGGPGGQLSSEFVSEGVIALAGSISANGKDEVGNLAPLSTMDQFIGRVGQGLSGYDPKKRAELAKVLYRFCHEIRIGDYVLTYNPNDGFFALGKVISEYEFNLDVIINRPHTRLVYFTSEKFSRHDLSIGTNEALKKIRHVYQIQKEAAEEILLNYGSTLEHVVLNVAARSETEDSSHPRSEQKQQEEGATFPTIENGGDLKIQTEPLSQSNRSSELINDQIFSLAQGDLEKLVYGLLRAMGYMIRVPHKAPNNCVDILATSDGLGFKMTTIAVAVKHDNNSVEDSGIRAL